MTTPQPPYRPGTPDPWSRPPQIGLPPPAYDMLASPAEQTLHKGRRGRTPLILVAVAAVVASLLGGGAYAGVRLWNGSGAQPEEATPASVLAFARLDLSPGYGQKLKINNLLKKFPQHSGKDPREELTQGVFDALDIDEASFREHVEPWFADRVGVALWRDDSKQPYGLIVLATDDETAARGGLTQLQRKEGAEKFGFRVQDGFALVARGSRDAQDAAVAAAADAAQQSLATSAQFRGDVDWLPNRQTALAWVDLARTGEALTSTLQAAVPDGAGIPTSPASGLFGGLLGPGRGAASFGSAKGRVVVGAQATDNGVEIRFRTFDTPTAAQPATAHVRSIVDSLPGNSIVAGSVQVGEFGESLQGLVPDADTIVPDDLLKNLPPEETEVSRAQLERTRNQYKALGEAVSSIDGAKISLAVSKVEGGVPGLAASADTTSAEKAAALADAAKLLGDDVTVTTSGSKVELKTKAYAADGGTLAGQALYREALDGAPKNASVVLYLDVQRLFARAPLSEQARQDAAAFKAVGLATGTEDGDAVGLIRLVIR